MFELIKPFPYFYSLFVQSDHIEVVLKFNDVQTKVTSFPLLEICLLVI